MKQLQKFADMFFKSLDQKKLGAGLESVKHFES